MSLIPFILDLADELHEYNRCLATIGGVGVGGGGSGGGAGSSGMDVDDFGFGIYPHELQPPTQQPLQQQQQQQQQLRESQHSLLLRRPRTYSTQLYWLPSVKQQRIHPYSRNKVCCGKFNSGGINEAAADTAPVSSTRESGTSVGTNTASGGGGTSSLSSSAAASSDGVGVGVSSTSGAVGAAKSSYSVVNKNGFQVSMNVKQFAANELTVKTIDNCIVVEGQHEDKEDGHGVISRHFIRKYMLPKGYDPAEVLSTLSSDGILTVKAPPPSPPKTDKPMERIVDIEQTDPTHSIAKDVNKEHVKLTAVTATTPVAVSQQTKPQQQQQLNEHNTTNANNNNNNNDNDKNMHDAPADMEVTITPPIAAVPTVSTAADDAVPEKTSELSMLVTNNVTAVDPVANNNDKDDGDGDAIMSAVVDGKVDEKDKMNVDVDVSMSVSVSVNVNDGNDKLMEKIDDNKSDKKSNGNDENAESHIGKKTGTDTGIANNTATVTSNNIAASSADDAVITAEAPVEERNGGIAVIPITAAAAAAAGAVPVAAAELPSCNEVVVAMETETNTDATNLSTALIVEESETDITITDGKPTSVSVDVKHETTVAKEDGELRAVAVNEAEQVSGTKTSTNAANNVGETVTATESTASSALAPTTANLVAAADAAILLAKAHNRSVAVAEENGNKVVAIAEELAN